MRSCAIVASIHHLVKARSRCASASSDGMGAPAATCLDWGTNSKPKQMLVTKV